MPSANPDDPEEAAEPLAPPEQLLRESSARAYRRFLEWSVGAGFKLAVVEVAERRHRDALVAWTVAAVPGTRLLRLDRASQEPLRLLLGQVAAPPGKMELLILTHFEDAPDRRLVSAQLNVQRDELARDFAVPWVLLIHPGAALDLQQDAPDFSDFAGLWLGEATAAAREEVMRSTRHLSAGEAAAPASPAVPGAELLERADAAIDAGRHDEARDLLAQHGLAHPEARASFERVMTEGKLAASLGRIGHARIQAEERLRAREASRDDRPAPPNQGATSSELRLLFTRNGSALTYRLATSWGGDTGEPQPFELFLTDADYEDLRWYLEDYIDLPIGGAKVRAERVERSLTSWGKRLFDIVFGPGDHRELYNELLDGAGTKLLTVGTKDLDVLRLPWELMADSRGPLTRRGVTIRRQLETARRSEKYETGKLPLRILLAVSRPDDTGFIDPRHTTRAMLDALAPLGNGVVVDFCRPATLPQMERMLREAQKAGHGYQIVHFDGHGTFLPASQIGALCFEKEEDEAGVVKTDFVRADRLGDLLTAHALPLVILEACQSGKLGSVAAFRGVATALIEAGVGSVLSMSHAVHVEAAKILLERFYEELVGGASVGTGVEQGRAAMMAKPERWLARGPGAPSVELKDWFLPNLYQRGTDLVLVSEGVERAPREGA